MAAPEGENDLWKAADTVHRAAEDARKRLKRRSPGWWRDEAVSGRPRADVVADTIATLASYDPAAPGTPPRPPRDETLTDQLTVVAYDLTLAIRDGAEVDAATAADAIATCLRDVDPRS